MGVGRSNSTTTGASGGGGKLGVGCSSERREDEELVKVEEDREDLEECMVPFAILASPVRELANFTEALSAELWREAAMGRTESRHPPCMFSFSSASYPDFTIAPAPAPAPTP